MQLSPFLQWDFVYTCAHKQKQTNEHIKTHRHVVLISSVGLPNHEKKKSNPVNPRANLFATDFMRWSFSLQLFTCSEIFSQSSPPYTKQHH